MVKQTHVLYIREYPFVNILNFRTNKNNNYKLSSQFNPINNISNTF
ncbi:hypothetical protein EV194_101738 [Natronoflexus pectinivorans]|uniref:Uncharacterized protein n=1 Tax=Natronoflexus pectinivorans TaxID=682526 RepID=A0A4R2GP24_9BACT|nr:hypothetical protein EV194_101738 [Natronoflexus pectinivorans]